MGLGWGSREEENESENEDDVVIFVGKLSFFFKKICGFSWGLGWEVK